MDDVTFDRPTSFLLIALLATAGKIEFEQGAAETLWCHVVDGEVGVAGRHPLLTDVTGIVCLGPHLLFHPLFVLTVNPKLDCIFGYPCTSMLSYKRFGFLECGVTVKDAVFVEHLNRQRRMLLRRRLLPVLCFLRCHHR